MTSIRLLFALVAALLLSGCYQSSVELFPRGEKLPLAGNFICDGKKAQTMVFVEKASGIPFFTRSYRYGGQDDKDPGYFAGAKVADNLWVLQSWGNEKSRNNGAIVWVETTPSGLSFLAPNLMGQSGAIDALFKQHKVSQASGGQLGVFQLRGETSDIRALAQAHRREHLMPIGACKKA